VFAILGLRAMYFLLADVIHKFHYLKIGLSVVLVFVGAKMLMADIYQVPITLSLGIIVLVLAAATGASLLWPASDARHDPLVPSGGEPDALEEGATPPPPSPAETPEQRPAARGSAPKETMPK
jgi:tellurite resistance protein TerC